MHEHLTFMLHQAELPQHYLVKQHQNVITNALFSSLVELIKCPYLTNISEKIRQTQVFTIYMVCLEMINCIFTQIVRSPTIAMQSEFTTFRVVVQTNDILCYAIQFSSVQLCSLQVQSHKLRQNLLQTFKYSKQNFRTYWLCWP